MVKNLPAMWETWVQSLSQEDPLEKAIVTHSCILSWRIPWTEEPGRLQSMGSQRVRHNWATNTHPQRNFCKWNSREGEVAVFLSCSFQRRRCLSQYLSLQLSLFSVCLSLSHSFSLFPFLSCIVSALLLKSSFLRSKVKVKSLSCVQLFATPWTVAYKVPPSMEFSRQEHWSGLPFPSPGHLPDPGVEPVSPALQADAFTCLSHQGSPSQVLKVRTLHILDNWMNYWLIKLINEQLQKCRL